MAANFVLIDGGDFYMGSNGGYSDEKPVHKVTIQPFAMSKYEVMQMQWQAVMGNNPSVFKGCAECPVDKVSWDDVQKYIQKLNQKTGKKFRLPTEAEWEYACRSGGKKQTYCGGNNVTDAGWYQDNAEKKTHPVGLKEPNGLGLYDMSGNVNEWVEDCWNDSYSGGAPANGSAWNSGDCSVRVQRGGSIISSDNGLKSTRRGRGTANSPGFGNQGFRLVHD